MQLRNMLRCNVFSRKPIALAMRWKKVDSGRRQRRYLAARATGGRRRSWFRSATRAGSRTGRSRTRAVCDGLRDALEAFGAPSQILTDIASRELVDFGSGVVHALRSTSHVER